MIQLRVLGPLELRDADGRELRAIVAQPRRLGLLAYLAVAPPASFHRRDTLLGLFWPELDGPHARAALNQAIRFLRKSLSDDSRSVIVSRGGEEIGIDPAAFWCDASIFRDHVAASRYAEAMELYRGDLLDGFFLADADGFETWLERERAVLRTGAARAARALAEQRERDEHFTTAVACARRAVELSDVDERRVRELLELLDRLGDRAGAVHAYDRFAGRLATEFAAEPSAETKAVIERIRARADSESRSANGEIKGWPIVRELGRGGMATVYLATDAKHGRNVALKIMHPELALSIGPERFLQEIQIMGQLAHPHILPLIDSGAANGSLYLVAPYIDGESLRDRLRREGKLAVDDALRIARDVAGALDYAHRHGVIHRDVKPANILLQDGQAIVADFGIALALNAASSDRSASGGASPGTPSYMSPEQLAGGGAIDRRSDVYSLGVVLHEMLTGAMPPSPYVAPDELPPQIAAALTRALSRTPPDRFASTGEFARALDSTAGDSLSPAGTRRTPRGGWRRSLRIGAAAAVSVAVLTGAVARLRAAGIPPFGSLLSSGTVLPNEKLLVTDFRVSGADSSVGIAVTTAMLAALSRSTAITVLSSDGVRDALRRMKKPPAAGVGVTLGREIAQREAIRAIVAGHVIRAGRDFDIGVRLISADSGRELAVVRTSAHSMEEVIPAIDALARELRTRMGESLRSVRATPPLPHEVTPSIEALRMYAQALREPDQQKEIALLNDAVRADSEFAMAWRRLWITYGNSGLNGPARDSALVRAARYGSRLPETERLLVLAAFNNAPSLFLKAQRSKAISIYEQLADSGQSTSLINLPEVLMTRREFARPESLEIVNVRKFPDLALVREGLVHAQVELGKLNEADAMIDSSLRRAPAHWPLQWWKVRMLYLRGQLDAFEHAVDSLRALPDPTRRRIGTDARANVALLRGRLKEWARLRAEARELASAAGGGSTGDVVDQAYVDIELRGDSARAVERLRAATRDFVPRRAQQAYIVGRAFARAGRPDLARMILARYAAIADTGWRRKEQFFEHRLLGEIAIAEGRGADAVDEVKRGDVVEDGPAQSCFTCFHRDLGFAFDRAGQTDSAIANFERFVEAPSAQTLSSHSAYLSVILRRLGELYESEGKRDRAVYYYSRFVDLWKSADPELQPQVRDMRRRISRLKRSV